MSSLAKISISFLDRFLLQNVCRSAFLLQQRSLRSRPIDDLPEKPKRPPSVWLLFLAERRNELHEQAEEDQRRVEEFRRYRQDTVQGEVQRNSLGIQGENERLQEQSYSCGQTPASKHEVECKA